MSGARAIADMLAGYGTTHMFLVPAVLRRTMREIEERTSITPVRTHGEKSAVYMADGYARARRAPGICAAQAVGAMNLAAGLREPWLAHSPVLAITGGRDPKTKFRGVYQEVDDIPSFEKVTKWNATVDSVERVPDMLNHAFRVAVTGAPGPVHLQFRGNAAQMDEEVGEIEATCDPRLGHVPPHRVAPDPEDLRRAAAALARASRPLLVAGGGCRASGGGERLVALAELLDIPIATSLNGKDSVPGTHPLSVGVVGTYSRGSANRVAARADLVCYVGSGTGGMVTDSWRLPPLGTRVVQIDIDPEALGRNYPQEVGVLGDARTALESMATYADPSTNSRRSAWLDEVSLIKAEWSATWEPALTSDAVPMRPERLCRDLSSILPSDALVVVDTGNAGMWMGGMFDLTSPAQSYLRSAGHLGWAMPAGLGAKAALPNRPVVVFTGDAGLWYHIAEIETAVRNRLNLVVIVNNNNGGNQSSPAMDRVYDGSQSDFSRRLWTFTQVDLARVAQGMGAEGIRVTRPQDYAGALERAFELDRPVVVDVETDIDLQPPLPV